MQLSGFLREQTAQRKKSKELPGQFDRSPTGLRYTVRATDTAASTHGFAVETDESTVFARQSFAEPGLFIPIHHATRRNGRGR